MHYKLIQNIQSTWGSWNKNKNIRYGLPFIFIVVGSSFGLKYYTSFRYEYRQTEKIDPKEFEKAGIEMKPPGSVTLETEFEKIKNLDIDNWKNIRGPRPWEDNSEFEELKEKRLAEKAKLKNKEATE